MSKDIQIISEDSLDSSDDIVFASDGSELSQIEEGIEEKICTVCGTKLEEPVVQCDECSSYFHKECWDYCGVCPAIGCGCKEFKTVITSSTALTTSQETEPDLYIGDDDGGEQNSFSDGVVRTLVRIYCTPAVVFANSALQVMTGDDSYSREPITKWFLSSSSLPSFVRSTTVFSLLILFMMLASANMIPEAVIVTFLYYISTGLLRAAFNMNNEENEGDVKLLSDNSDKR